MTKPAVYRMPPEPAGKGPLTDKHGNTWRKGEQMWAGLSPDRGDYIGVKYWNELVFYFGPLEGKANGA